MKRKLIIIFIVSALVAALAMVVIACNDKGSSSQNSNSKSTIPTLDAVRIYPVTRGFNGDYDHDVCLDVIGQSVEKFDVEIVLKNPDKYEIASVTINENEYTTFDKESTASRVRIKNMQPDETSGDYPVVVNDIRYVGKDGKLKQVVFSDDRNVKNVRIAPVFKITFDLSDANIPDDGDVVADSSIKYGSVIKGIYESDMNGTAEGQYGYEDLIFVGWFTDPEEGEKVTIGDKFYFYSDITLYARYASALKYSVGDDEVTVTGLTDEGKATSFAIVIPETIEDKPVTKIGSYAFSGVGSNKAFILGNNVKTIEAGAFRGCQNMQIDLGRVVTIGTAAFEDCGEIVLGQGQKQSTLRIAELPSTLEEIGNYAFRRSGFDLMRFPNPAREDVMYRSENTLFIPPTVRKIGKYAFQESLFVKVFFAVGNLLPTEMPTYDSKSGSYDYTDYDLGEGIFEGSASLTTVYTGYSFTASGIPMIEKADYGLAIITDRMFYNCRRLKSFDRQNISGVALGEGLVFVGAKAFASTNQAGSATSGMPDYKVQEFPSGLKVIAESAFANTALADVTFNKNCHLEKLGDWCFQETLMSEITIYDLDSYGMDPFWGNVNIRKVRLLTTSIPEYRVPSSSTVTRYMRFYVHANLLAGFRKDDGWSSKWDNKLGFSMAITDIMCAEEYNVDGLSFEPVNELGVYDPASRNVRINFMESSSSTVVVPATFSANIGGEDIVYTVTRIGSYVALPEVREVKLPYTVTHIEDYAFYSLIGLNKITWIDESGKALADNAIGDISLKRIGAYAFYITSLTKFYSNAVLEEIGMQAFYGCTKLDDVVLDLGDNMIIRGSAFSNSTINLLIIGDGVKIIEGAAFMGQSEELTIYFKSDIPPYAYYTNGIGYYSAVFPFKDCRNIRSAYLFSNEAMSNYVDSASTGYRDLKKTDQITSAYTLYAGTWSSMLAALGIA